MNQHVPQPPPPTWAPPSGPAPGGQHSGRHAPRPRTGPGSRSPWWLRSLSWLVDVAVSVGVAYAAHAGTHSLPVAIGAFLLAPLVHGLLTARGHSLGGLVTGTRFVSAKTGRPIGRLRMMWVILLRVVLGPVLWAIGGAFDIDVTDFGGLVHEQVRV